MTRPIAAYVTLVVGVTLILYCAWLGVPVR
jgi:hypothetical protein